MPNPTLITRALTDLADGYKYCHYRTYGRNIESMQFYLEARKPGQLRFFGLQDILLRLIRNPLTGTQVEATRTRLARYFGREDVFNYDGFMRIVDIHGGHLPVSIRAVPEGTVVPGSNVLFNVVGTDPELPWVPSFIEDILMQVWYPTTVCTRSYQSRQLLLHYLDKTADNPAASIDFMLHDFGLRGVSGMDSAELGGLAHLVNFQGTDTFNALIRAEESYAEPNAGFTIPALEHSVVITQPRSQEADVYRRFIQDWGRPGEPLAIVVDAFDDEYAVTEILGKQLKQFILDSGVKLMVRFDSGDPVESIRAGITRLAAIFGTTRNRQGYKLLNTVGVVQGNGVTPKSMTAICDMLLEEGFCVSNVVFGQGGALLQKLDRDTLGFAYKPSLVKYDNATQLAVRKTPKDDPFKASKSGDLDLVRQFGNGLITIDRLTTNHPYPSQLREVYRDGELLIEEDLATIRARF